jgi:hypothetical protein
MSYAHNLTLMSYADKFFLATNYAHNFDPDDKLCR